MKSASGPPPSASPAMPPRFEDVTEATGIPLSLEGASMMYTRYNTAVSLAAGRRVLEIGCGAGQGFGLLSQRAAYVVGGDPSAPLLRSAKKHYGSRVPLVRLSADALPFREGSFDLVLFFEASYYVPNMERAFDDIARVLSQCGIVVFVNANPERPDFITSPHSVHYHTAAEFTEALTRRGFAVEVSGAFSVDAAAKSASSRMLGWAFSVARRVFETFGMVPRTLSGRARLKRLLYRKLTQVPAELQAGFADVASLTPLGPGRHPEFKVIYVVGRREHGG